MTGIPNGWIMGRMEPLATLMLKWMAERHLDQKDAAEILGFSAGTVSRWLNGQRAPSFEDAIKIARGMKCSLDELGGLVVKTRQRAHLDELIEQFGEKETLRILLAQDPPSARPKRYLKPAGEVEMDFLGVHAKRKAKRPDRKDTPVADE